MELKEHLKELESIEVKSIGGIKPHIYLSIKDKCLNAGVTEVVFYRKPSAIIEAVFKAISETA